ncbi:MAG: hypothetical protein WAO58_08260 [Fimbriimonadaceae bacterium]
MPLLLAIFIAGCGGGADVVGKYKMTATIPANDPSAAMAAKLMEQMTLELKADKTFDMTMMQGTYTVSGDTVEMTPTKVMGMDATKSSSSPKTMKMKIQDGGKTLIPIDETPNANAPKDAKFVRI